MTISTARRIGVASWTFGPIGMVVRHHVRTLAFSYGIALEEDRGLLSSMYRANGSFDSIEALKTGLLRISDEMDRLDHVSFVDDMERSEKRRAFWGRLIGRKTRHDQMSHDEIENVVFLLTQVRMMGTCEDDAERRLSRSISDIRHTLRLQASSGQDLNMIAGTYAAMGMRHLQHDVRRENVVLPAALKKRVMAIVPTIETWEA